MAVKPNQKHLGVALLAAATSALGVAFVAGCFYPCLLRLLSVHRPSPMRAEHGDISVMILLDFGFVTALIALPTVFVLTCGAGFPLFRQWVRRGYSDLAAYVGGGIIVAMIGASIFTAAHIFGGFLLGTDFSFAMLIIAVCGPIAGFVVWYVLRRLSSDR